MKLSLSFSLLCLFSSIFRSASLTPNYADVPADDVTLFDRPCRIEWTDTRQLVAIARCIDEVEEPTHSGPNHVDASTIAQMRAAYTIRSKLEKYETNLDIQASVRPSPPPP